MIANDLFCVLSEPRLSGLNDYPDFFQTNQYPKIQNQPHLNPIQMRRLFICIIIIQLYSLSFGEGRGEAFSYLLLTF